MDILSLRLFLRITELGSVSAAGRDLSLSPASASSRLNKLEEQVGVRLFHRTTRAISLTTDGAAFLPYAQQSIDMLELGLGTVRGEGTQAQGVLRMTMPGSFGRMYIIPILHKFHALHPLVRLDIRLSDEVLNVVEGAFDLIIRNASLHDSSFVARKLASDRRILVASPCYIARRGAPATPAEITKHQCVVLSSHNKWKFDGEETVHAPSSFVVNDGEAMRSMLEQGFGIGVKSMWNVRQSLESGRLVELLPERKVITESSIWALYPSGRIVPSKVRAMIDFLVDEFSPVPEWEREQLG